MLAAKPITLPRAACIPALRLYASGSHTGLQAVHNRGTLSTQGKAHLPANARSGTPGPTDSLTGPRSDPAYETAPRTVRTVPSLVLATTPRVSNRRTDPLDSTLGIVRLVANNTRNS